MKKIIKIISMLLVIIQLTTIIFNVKSVNASINENDVILLEADHECDSLVEYQTPNGWWSYKIVWYVYYKDKDTNKKYPAFCVEPAKEGVGTGYSEYNTTISKETDSVIWRILYKGYMGSKYTDWNLECDDDLYSATKIALHSYKDGINPKGKYILGNRSVDGNTVEEIQRRGAKVLDVAETLYDYGTTTSKFYKPPKIDIIEDSNRIIQMINNEKYLIQNYRVNSNNFLKSYEVSISDFTNGAKILNSNNQESTSFNNDSFKIAIPINNIKEGINGKVFVKNAQVKTNPIYYAKSSIAGAQSYVIYTEPYENTNASKLLILDANTSSLEILKIDSETRKPIPNVTFEIKNETGESLGKYETDENGLIKIDKLIPGKIRIKEIKVGDKYIIDSKEKEVALEWGELSKIEVLNERKKGNLKIEKVDKEDNNIKLEGVEFEIYNNKKELVLTAATNDKGEIYIENLDIGEYTLKEIKTNNKYVLDRKEKQVLINWNKTTNIKIENERKKGSLKIIKTSKEDNIITGEIAGSPIADVEFEVRNEKGELIQTLKTDKDGKAYLNGLDLGIYTIKETKANPNYYLNEEEIKVYIDEIEENKTLNITNDPINKLPRTGF